MVLQWFPGHMAKTRRMITDHLKLVDLVIELCDARLPLSSRNPEVDGIIKHKPRILILNKCDMADSDANQRWLNYFAKQGVAAIAADSLSGKGLKQLDSKIDEVLAEKFERDAVRGIQRHAVKMMVVGIPNVGKSSFINRLAGRASAKTGDRPGVTTTKQWIRIAGKYELLDTPGILWPKFEDPEAAKRIAFTGGIKDEIMDIEELACLFLEYMKGSYPSNLTERYKLNESDLTEEPYELLHIVGRKRGCVVSGGEIDTMRAARLLLDDFRSVKLGAITLELPTE